jgi:hypothetical protein
MSGADLLYTDADIPTITKQPKTNGTIYKWYPWSYLNVIFGCLIMDFIAIFLSFHTTMYKEADNHVRACLWSLITLFWNILSTSVGLGLTFYAILKQ